MMSCHRIISSIAAVIAVACCTSRLAFAFTTLPPQSLTHSKTTTATVLYSEQSSRRSFLSTIATASITCAFTAPVQPARAAATKEELIADLTTSLQKISTIPSLLESAEWDKARTILKTPPVNSLWNLGESQNTLVKLAKETGDFDLLEIKEELAISLQMTDQYSYDNVFIYYQPGNGKVKTKEPLEMANKAIAQLKQVLDIVNAN
ncbi:hypothetical protein HJC23_013424 [Cyclotella cryptica]|uniref:Uncharacterized protein n=1 Tax=Cyclotella cryptica TaxID=29204 RepID=A0ABD3P6H5_9STRA|eukprot:CCRYP_017253-RA/>CCRYP_017253-RA protein AED:0.41 eAED:0.41 QI:130/1/1/1/1/1/2/315/205